MATTSTPNLDLVKPTLGTGEHADVSVINGNMDKIDAAVGDVDAQSDGSLQEQIDNVKSSIKHGISGAGSSGVIIFDEPFNSDNYTVTLTPLNSNPNIVFACHVISKSASQFTFQCRYALNNSDSWQEFKDNIMWLAVGV